MPYQNMSLDDFARYVGMDARDVRRQADRGLLPGKKIGGQWRFNRARVTEWLQQEMSALDEGRLRTLERAMGGRSPGEADELVLTNFMGVEGIDLTCQARTKDSVLRELVKLAERTGLLYHADDLLAAVVQREEMCSTALAQGVAIPHPRQVLPFVSAEPMVCLARLARGIGFGAPDGGLTDIFFLICCHEDQHHLQILARLVRVLGGESIEELRAVEQAGDALQLLIARERAVIGRNG
ncbi:MAG: PTS sugar transporter subunit IIA [Planctomycetes bacterium]|nr:PTS sugar transporter subunit IIA [Planctomycetota bacterium]